MTFGTDFVVAMFALSSGGRMMGMVLMVAYVLHDGLSSGWTFVSMVDDAIVVMVHVWVVSYDDLSL